MASTQTRLAVITFLLLFLSSACLLSCSKATPENTIEALKQRAGEYWGYRINNQQDKAFGYELPQSVNGVALAQYRTKLGTGVNWLGAKADQVDLNGEEATVHMKIRYLWTFTSPSQQPPEGFEDVYFDRWKFQDGTWYHIFRKSAMDPSLQQPKAEPPKAEEQPTTTEQPIMQEQPAKVQQPANADQPGNAQQPGNTEKQ